MCSLANGVTYVYAAKWSIMERQTLIVVSGLRVTWFTRLFIA